MSLPRDDAGIVTVDVVVRDQRFGRNQDHVDESGLGEVLRSYRMPAHSASVPEVGDTLVLDDGQAVEVVGVQDVLTDGGFLVTAIIADHGLREPSV
jgi:hypothetical protein